MTDLHHQQPPTATPRGAVGRSARPANRWRSLSWVAFVVAVLLLLDVVSLVWDIQNSVGTSFHLTGT